MKPTYDSYSKGVLGLKAALLAPILSMLKSWVEAIEPEVISARYVDNVVLLCVALTIFLFDLIFNLAFRLINELEIQSRRRELRLSISRLEEILSASPSKKVATEAQRKIQQLTEELVRLS